MDDHEKNLTHVKGSMKKYGVFAGAALQEDLGATVVIDVCAKNFQGHLELSTFELRYTGIREDVLCHVERKTTSSAQFKNMEVVSYEEQRKEPDQTPGSNTRKPEA